MTTRDYAAITSISQLDRLVSMILSEEKPIGWDLETGYSGDNFAGRALDHYNEHQFVVGFSFTNNANWARYVPLAHDSGGNIDASPAEVWEVMRPLLENKHIVSFHQKFERAAVWKAAKIDLGVNGKVSDPMLAAYVLGKYYNESWRTIVGLKELVLEMYGHKMMHIHELWPDLPQNKHRFIRFNTLDVTPESIAYACEDAVFMIPMEKDLCQVAAKENLFMYTLEHKIADMMVEVERYGVTVDWDALKEGYEQGQTFLPEMEQFVKTGLGELVGRDLSDMNLNSSVQKQRVLFDEIGLSTTALTKSGKMSASKKSLEGLAKEYKAVRDLLEYGEARHLTNRFKKWLTENAECFDRRIHPTYNQVTVPSGRFSANTPTIQNCPSSAQVWFSQEIDFDPDSLADQDKLVEYRANHINGVEYWYTKWRDYVVAKSNHYLVTFDFSQAELRALAGMSQEPMLLNAFTNDEDIHAATASGMLGIPVDQLTKELRKRGKTLNFGLIYGQGPKAMGEQLGISFQEAKALYQAYFARFTNVASWFNKTKQQGHQNGYVKSIFGRKIPIWELLSDTTSIKAKGDRVIINSGVQGAVADLVKVIMLQTRRVLIERGWWCSGVMMVMNQHDALTFEVSNEIDPNELRALLQPVVVLDNEKFENLRGFPPFKADWELGQKWGSSEKWELNQTAIFDGTHWIVQPEPELESLVVLLEENPSEKSFRDFIAKLKKMPGQTQVSLNLPEGVVQLPFTSGVTETVAKDLCKLFKNVRMEIT